MEFKNIDEKIIDGWRSVRVIRLLISLVPALLGTLWFEIESIVGYIIIGGLWAICLYCLLSLIVFPPLEYKRWGYYIDHEKVVIRRGLFFIKETTIPIIRIQNITVSQGPINQYLELYKVEIALASDSFEILGLTKETAESINENLRAKLYDRIAEKGVL